MKTELPLFAFVLLLASAPGLFAQSTNTAPTTSAKTRILEAYAYEAPPSIIQDPTGETPSIVPFRSEATEEMLATKLTVRRKPPHDPLERVKILGTVRDGSFLSNVSDTISLWNEEYRTLKSGLQYSVMGQSVTVYVQSRVVFKIGKREDLELSWSGRGGSNTKSLAYVFKF
jgi:hypothetical protein